MSFIQAAYFAAILAVSNFLYQWMGDELWLVASERSYFQACALFITWFVLKVTGAAKEAA